MDWKKVLSHLHVSDAAIIFFTTFLSFLNLVFHSRVLEWWLLVLANSFVSSVAVLLAYFTRRRLKKIWMFIHDWYPVPVILFSFKELYLMIHPIHPVDFDHLFISIDYWLFGVHPTQWLARFAHPLITEILQFVYATFYFWFFVIGIELYRQRRIEEFYYTSFLIVYGFYLSYVFYILLPAVGPRFTLHSFDSLNTELPGLLFTNVLRDFVNLGESIPKGASNAIDFAQRDVFPSGHTQLTLVVMYLAFKYHLTSRWFLFVIGILLLFSTVYLRYHYVIDVIAGAVLMLLTIFSAPMLYRWWYKETECWARQKRKSLKLSLDFLGRNDYV